MLVGAHVTEGDESFRSFWLRTSGAPGWVGERVVGPRSGADVDDAGGEAVIDWINYVRPVSRTATFARGSLTLNYGWAESGSVSVSAVSFSHWPAFGVRYDNSFSMESMLKDAQRINDLLTLCADEASYTTRLSFQRPDVRVRMLSGDFAEFEQEVVYLAGQVGRILGADVRRRRHPHQMLLTFDDLGGLDAIGRWLDLAPQIDRSLNSLMSVKRTPRIYSENRFLNVAFAAEAYHRDLNGAGEEMGDGEFDTLVDAFVAITPVHHQGWIRQRLSHANDFSFRRRLPDLAERGGDALTSLVGNRTAGYQLLWKFGTT